MKTKKTTIVIEGLMERKINDIVSGGHVYSVTVDGEDIGSMLWDLADSEGTNARLSIEVGV